MIIQQSLNSLMHSNTGVSKRSAVTLMEVIFSIGVILTGLLGLAALIPIAANNAQSAMEMDRSISESTSVAAASVARQFTKLDALVLHDQPSVGSPARGGTSATADPYGYEPLDGLYTVEDKLEIQASTTIPLNPLIGKLESPGYGHHPLDAGLRAGLCLDPLGLPDPAFTTFTAGSNAFDYSRFPYYSERYEIVEPPNDAVSPMNSAPSWPMSPRMWRVTLRTQDYVPGTALSRFHIINPRAAQRIFGSSGGLSGIESQDDDDNGLPKSVLIDQSNIGGTLVDASTNQASDYTWMATYAPVYGSTTKFRESVVVIRKRVAPTPKRAGDVLALDRSVYTVVEAEENPSAERIAYVDSTIGFSGGAGGDVLLVGSQKVSNEIKVNQWVMLSRQPHVGAVPTGAAVHRWFRVLRVNEPEFDAAYTIPGGSGAQAVWKRWVTLAGSDWVFSDGYATDARDDTFCTIVSGAVSVVESELVLE